MEEQIPTNEATKRPTERALTPLHNATKRVGHDPLAERLLEIRTWLSDDLASLERAIRVGTNTDEVAGESSMMDLATQASTYLLGRPGKRIRPLCVMLGARLGGRTLDRSVKDLAVCCEMVHTATLLHDDVIDEGTERRGAPAARMVFGNAASVLAGDHLLLYALKLAEGVGYRSLMGQLLDTISEMVLAEAVQLEQRGTLDPCRDTYLRVIQGKTAGLFRWALVAGGTVGGLGGDHLAALGHVGNSLGLAFQLMDDVLDLEGDPAVTGKDLLVDLKEGKLTWPFIIAAERDPSLLPAVETFLSSAEEGESSPDVRPVLEILLATDALTATREFARHHAESALESLSQVPACSARRAIEVVVEAAINRRN